MLNLSNLLSFNVFTLFDKTHKVNRVKNSNAINYSEIAFQIASTNDLWSTLQAQLAQPALHAYCASQISTFENLLILHPNIESKNSLTFAQNTPSSLLFRSYFETTQINPDTTFTLNRIDTLDGYSFLPVPLKQNQQHYGYLIMCFRDAPIATTPIIQLLTPMQKALEKGLNAHQQKTQAIIDAVNLERVSQAADMHDSIAQILSYLKLKSASLSSLCKTPQHEVLHTLSKDIETQVSYAHRLTREIISSSRLALNETLLSTSIQAAVAEFEQISSIVFELDNRCKNQIENVKDSKEVLFIIRESLCNLVRHAHASHARIVITEAQSGIVNIRIEDNGTGIDLSTKQRNNFGLQIMHERARKIGAHLNIRNRDEGGTQVHLSVSVQD